VTTGVHQEHSNSALEQAASAARPWQKAHRMLTGSGGPRPGHRLPLLTASVRRLDLLHSRPEVP
jgi:hypothetical protein